MSLREFVRVDGEIKDSEFAKVILSNYYSRSMVNKAEEILIERQKKLQETIERLKTDLENLNLSKEKRYEIFERIIFLEGSTIREYFSLPIAAALHDCGLFTSCKTELSVDVDRTNTLTITPEYFTFNNEDCFLSSDSIAPSSASTWLFVGEYVEETVQWRAVSFEVLKKISKGSDFQDIIPLSQKPKDQCPRGIDEDSLSHFQNCPIPPGFVMPNSEISTQIGPYDMLANGCSVSITLNISNSGSQIGGIKWKNSKKLSKEASEPYVKLQTKYLGNSISSSTCYQSFSVNIRNSWRKSYPPLSASRPLSSVVIMPKPSVNFAFYLYSSDYNGKRSNVIINGEMN